MAGRRMRLHRGLPRVARAKRLQVRCIGVAALRSAFLRVRFQRFVTESGLTANVESFGRRQASESLRCPNRGGHEPSYGESCFALMVGKPGAAQNRTYLRSDRLNMDGESGRRKADGGILRFRRLLLGSAVASGVASRRGCALDRVCARPCRVTAQVSRMRPQAGAARGADSGARRPR